jgi:hypothetical protein
MLGSADYTATDGVSVVLASGATSGDLIETISFYVSSVLNAIPASPSSVGTSYLVDGSVTTTKIADSNVTTAKILDANVTPAKLSQPLTSGTAVTASGTSVDFTGIPSWVKRITIVFNNISFNGSANARFRLGTSSGIITSGYGSIGGFAGTSSGGLTSSAGFDFYGDASAGSYRTGMATFVLLGSNIWSMSCSAYSGNTYTFFVTGGISLSGTLTTVQMTTSNGTDTFDAGSINILYE